MSKEALSRAIDKAGGQASLARVLGITYQAIDFWKRRSVPAAQVLKVEAATNGKITRHELRPDIFGPAPAQPNSTNAA